MAKKRSMKGYMKLPFDFGGAVGAILNGEVNGIDIGDTVNERTWISSLRAVIGTRAFTAGEGPATLFVAHSDYSNTEIEEALEAITSWDRGDLVAREHANRKVRVIGQVLLAVAAETLNDGKPQRIRVGMLLEEGDTLQFGLLATSGAITTGGVLEITGHANGWAR